MASSADTDNPSTPGPIRQQSSLAPHPSFDTQSNIGLGDIVKQSSKPSYPPGVQPESPEAVYKETTNSSHRETGRHEWLTVTVAGIIVGIQVQLLISSSMASSFIPRILLTLGMTSELVGVILDIYFIRFPANHYRKSNNALRMIVHAASEAPVFLVLLGIICLAAALVVDTLEVSIGTGIAMTGVLIISVLLCFLAWCLGIGEKAPMWD